MTRKEFQSATIRALFLVLLSGALASVHGLLLGPPPVPSPDPHALSIGTLGDGGDILWVDARSREQFTAGTVDDAVHLNLENWDSGLTRLLERWEPDRRIVVFCDARDCGTSRVVGERLRAELGLGEVYWLEGGWEELQTSWPVD